MMLLLISLLGLANAQTRWRNRMAESSGRGCSPQELDSSGSLQTDTTAQSEWSNNGHCCEQNTSQPPAAFDAVCAGNIVEWRNVPHDWIVPGSTNTYNTLEGDGTCRNNNFAKNNLEGEDLWYWGDDWPQRIASGSADYEEVSSSEGKGNYRCGSSSTYTSRGSGFTGDYVLIGLADVEECTKRCARASATTTGWKEKCKYFDFFDGLLPDPVTGNQKPTECHLYLSCNWPLRTVSNTASQIAGWTAYRLKDIYPVGFRYFTLREFNEPPTCIHVPNSHDKKVEVMIETNSKDSRICIMDGNDMGIGTNNAVGNVKTCDNGQLYACFTAATPTVGGVNEDFYFYIFCDGSCEAADVDLWVRIRVSERPWSAGKTDTESDIEMWCEMEKGTQAAATDSTGNVLALKNEFTWPSELLPDYPNQLPFRINHLNASPANMATVSTWVTALLGAAYLVLA